MLRFGKAPLVVLEARLATSVAYPQRGRSCLRVCADSISNFHRHPLVQGEVLLSTASCKRTDITSNQSCVTWGLLGTYLKHVGLNWKEVGTFVSCCRYTHPRKVYWIAFFVMSLNACTYQHKLGAKSMYVLFTLTRHCVLTGNFL